MRLRHGVTAAHAIKVLRELAMSVETARAAVVAGDGVRYRRDQYLSWADDAENRLRNLFAEQDLISSLHSERYWRIHNLEDYSARPTALLLAEIDLQLGLLLGAVDRLENYRRLTERSGEILVLDTNTFMHCRLLTEIRWCHEFSVRVVRLVLPLLVLDELDDKTFSAHARLSKRASKVLRTLDPFMDRVLEAGAAEITPGVTLEVLRDDEDHRRRGNNDTELLDRAEFLAQVTEQPVTLVTTDYGMRVRSRARNLRVHVMPEGLRLPLADD